MLSETIIQQFELQVSDITELSTSEEYVVLNRVYNRVCDMRPWEFLKTTASGSILSDADGSYIALPSDFAYLTENNSYTDNSIQQQNNAAPKVIFVGSTYTPYQVINFSDRRQYRNKSGFAYVDIVGSKIRFTNTPNGSTYEFDYIKTPTTLAAGVTPLIPSRFHDILVYGMAIDDSIIQLSPKATSYAPENKAYFDSRIADMAYWNANLIAN